MAVSNGQLANQTTFNNAFVSRTTDSDTTGRVDLENAVAASGANVTNVQREINSLNAFTGRPSGSAHDATPAWATSNVGTGSDTVKQRAEALDAEFNNGTGHAHSGVAGDGAPIAAEDLVGAFQEIVFEDPGVGTNTITLQAPTLAGSYTLTLPVDDGIAGQTIQVDGTGILSWVTPSTPSPGFIKVRCHDNISTTIPATGVPVAIDNVTLVDNDLVLFTNLSSGNNTIYKATVSGGNVTAWTLQSLYEGNSSTASDMDFVSIKEGDYYADNVLAFNGTAFFNFLDNKISYTIADNVTNTVMIELDTTRHQFFFMEYSITRGATTIRAGQLWAGSNGSTADINDLPTVIIGDIGVTWNANMSGTTLQIRYTTTNTGSSGTLKRLIRIW